RVDAGSAGGPPALHRRMQQAGGVLFQRGLSAVLRGYFSAMLAERVSDAASPRKRPSPPTRITSLGMRTPLPDAADPSHFITRKTVRRSLCRYNLFRPLHHSKTFANRRKLCARLCKHTRRPLWLRCVSFTHTQPKSAKLLLSGMRS